MTYKQEQVILKTREKIKEIRHMLDDIMYYSNEPLDDRDRMKISDAYKSICTANDLLP